MIIYRAINKKNGKMYIGQTTQSLKTRNSKRKYGSTAFDNAFNKYGEDGFIWETIDTANNINCLNKKESFWIEFYKTTNRAVGYNLQGGGANAYKTEEVKRKIGDAQLGSKNHMFGKKGADNPTSKRVINLNTGEIYNSGIEAMQSIGMKSEFYLYNSCNGKCSSIYGNRFRYVDEEGNFIPTRFDSEDYKPKDFSVWCLNDNLYFKTYEECSKYYNVDKNKILKQTYNINKNKETIDFVRLMSKGYVFVRGVDYEDCLILKDKPKLKQKVTKGFDKSVECIDDGRIFSSITDCVEFYIGLYDGVRGLSKSTMSNHLNKGAKFRYFNLTFKYTDEELKCVEVNNKIIGVCLDRNGFKSYGKINGRQTTLGTFKTKEEAIKCRLEYEKDYIGFNIAPQKHLFEQYGITL